MIDADLLPKVIERIDDWLAQERMPNDVIVALINSYGARHRYANGADELQVAGLKVSCTSGHYNTLTAWRAKARRFLQEQGQ